MCAGLLTSGTLRLKKRPYAGDVKIHAKAVSGDGRAVPTDNISEFELTAAR